MLEKTKLYSILKFKCPRCHKGEFLKNRNLFVFKDLGLYRKECSHCKLKYSKETGFYYGAMYISYGLGVALFVANWVAFTVLFKEYNVWNLIISICVSTILLSPYIFNLSKIIWINLFYGYEEKYSD